MKSIEDQAEEYADALGEIAETVRAKYETAKDIARAVEEYAGERELALADLRRENARLREALANLLNEPGHHTRAIAMCLLLPNPH